MSWFSGIINKNNRIKNFIPSNRWFHYSNGAILDYGDKDKAIWIADSSWFEKWFFGVEERLGLILGKMLIQASSESTEYFLISNQIQIPKNKDIGSWKELLEDWSYKNFGSFSSHSKSPNEINIIINNYANLYIAIGSLSGAFEYLTNNRYKFRWNDSETSIILNFEHISDIFPPPSPTQNNLHVDISDSKKINNPELWEMFSINNKGIWHIHNSRKIVISNDLFVRFEQNSLPFLSDVNFGRLGDYDWKLSDENKSNWWSASADSARELFIESAHHILIREDDDWKKVGQKHLGMYGLGRIIQAKSLDDFGETFFELESLFHPSVVCGILLACWERAYGKKGRLILTMNKVDFFVKISSSQDTLTPQY